MVAIVDYGVGNLFSLACSLQAVGAEAAVTGDPAVLEKADKIILPGVGAFGDAAALLRQNGLDKTVIRLAEAGKPLLGICLGMQLLFDYSTEYGRHEGPSGPSCRRTTRSPTSAGTPSTSPGPTPCSAL